MTPGLAWVLRYSYLFLIGAFPLFPLFPLHTATGPDYLGIPEVPYDYQLSSITRLESCTSFTS